MDVCEEVRQGVNTCGLWNVECVICKYIYYLPVVQRLTTAEVEVNLIDHSTVLLRVV